MAPKADNSLSELARRLLAGERGMQEPESLKARVLARARASFEEERLSRMSARRTPWAGVSPRARVARIALPAVGLAVAGLAVAAVNALLEPPSDAPRARLAFTGVVTASAAPLPPPRPSSRPESDVVIQPSPEVRAPAKASAARRQLATPARPSSARQYALELELLEPARRALAAGNYGAALDAVARHEQTFPSGQLSEERSALRVRALWASGRRSEASAAAERFQRGYPRSGLLNWMREARERSR